jgi:hypothetical protein
MTLSLPPVRWWRSMPPGLDRGALHHRTRLRHGWRHADAGRAVRPPHRLLYCCTYFIGGFTTLGLLAAMIVGVKEHEEVVADEKAAKADTADIAADTAAAAAVQMPLALLGALFTAPSGRHRS